MSQRRHDPQTSTDSHGVEEIPTGGALVRTSLDRWGSVSCTHGHGAASSRDTPLTATSSYVTLQVSTTSEDISEEEKLTWHALSPLS